MIQLYGKLFTFVQLVYLLSVKQQKVPDATETTKPEEVVDSVGDPAILIGGLYKCWANLNCNALMSEKLWIPKTILCLNPGSVFSKGIFFNDSNEEEEDEDFEFGCVITFFDAYQGRNL